MQQPQVTVYVDIGEVRMEPGPRQEDSYGVLFLSFKPYLKPCTKSIRLTISGKSINGLRLPCFSKIAMLRCRS
jgi:hypothetical protein